MASLYKIFLIYTQQKPLKLAKKTIKHQTKTLTNQYYILYIIYVISFLGSLL